MIQVENLTKYYRTLCAVDQINFDIQKMLGYLPESAPLYHDMLVYDYLNYVAAIREIKSDQKLARIRRLADLCGINEVMHQPIGELSKGYKQRVGLAHAMMNDPEVLVLDEPKRKNHHSFNPYPE